MNKKLMAVLGALSLVACGGSGKPWSGGDGPGPDQGWPAAGTWNGSAGTWNGSGGSEPSSEGGHEAGGSYAVGGSGIAGGYEAVGGYASAGTGFGGNASAGTGFGGNATAGTGSQDPACAQNVVHCFDAAANCYQYSPSSDCDQIVDVCAAMQMDCSE